MPSGAAAGFQVDSEKGRHLLRLASDARLRPLERQRSQAYLHAALTAYVAAWDAYIKALIREFFAVVANPHDPAFLAVHTIAIKNAELALSRFNTPNWDNTRRLLVTQTGYDPLHAWSWRQMSLQIAQQRLNEIMNVRHSFAHGFPIPALSWTTSAHGKIGLTATAVGDVERFFGRIVRQTDRGMADFIATQYDRAAPW
jgi:hypothetical protein